MEYVKALFRRVYQLMVKYPLAVAGTILLVVAAILLAIFGKKFQIGGLIGKLWGRDPDVNPNVRVLPPEDRVDKDGNLIMPGESDERGFVQPVATKIKEPGIFDDPNVVTVEHPDKGEVRIPLPTGIDSSEVEEIVEVAPDVYEVRNRDRGTDVSDLLDEI